MGTPLQVGSRKGVYFPVEDKSFVNPEFENIFTEIGPTIFRYLRRLLDSPVHAEDLLQETFMKLHLQMVSGAKIQNVRAWLFRVATNLARDKYRSELRSQVQNPLWPPPSNVIDLHARIEGCQVVHRVLRQISPRMRQILLLSSEGFSYREIAEVTGVELSYVGVLLQRARASFKEYYEEQNGQQDGLQARDLRLC